MLVSEGLIFAEVLFLCFDDVISHSTRIDTETCVLASLLGGFRIYIYRTISRPARSTSHWA